MIVVQEPVRSKIDPVKTIPAAFVVLRVDPYVARSEQAIWWIDAALIAWAEICPALLIVKAPMRTAFPRFELNVIFPPRAVKVRFPAPSIAGVKEIFPPALFNVVVPTRVTAPGGDPLN